MIYIHKGLILNFPDCGGSLSFIQCKARAYDPINESQVLLRTCWFYLIFNTVLFFTTTSDIQTRKLYINKIT